MHTTKPLLATMAACLASFSLYADINGKYNLSGIDPYNKNKPYSGTVMISKDQNDIYQVNWTILENGVEYKTIGTGIKTGSQVNVAFKNGFGQNEEYQGLQIYYIKDDTLEGPFVLVGKNLIGTEKLTKVP